MQRLALVLVGLVLAGAVVLLRADTTPRQPDQASAAPRLYVGFLDDQAFRWEPERVANFDRARQEGATVVRSIVELVGRRAAAAAPCRATGSRREYRLGDVDELVRNAEQRGIEVLLTIWGTPGWANGGARPNVAPSDPRDLRDFAHALAARYSGAHPAIRSSASTRSGTSRTPGSSSRRSSTPPAGRSRRASTPRWSRRPTRA